MNFNLNFVLWTVYFLSVIYCLWRINKRYKKSSHDGIVGMTPELDIIAVLFLGPVLAFVDIVVSWTIMVYTYYKNRKE